MDHTPTLFEYLWFRHPLVSSASTLDSSKTPTNHPFIIHRRGIENIPIPDSMQSVCQCVYLEGQSYGWCLFPLLPTDHTFTNEQLGKELRDLHHRIQHNFMRNIQDLTAKKEICISLTWDAYQENQPLTKDGYCCIFQHEDSPSFPVVLNLPLALVKRLCWRMFRVEYGKIPVDHRLQFLRQDFISGIILKAEFFPFEPRDFFNSLSEVELQHVVQVLWMNQLITHDMLVALAMIMENGLIRIRHTLSKNVVQEFDENYQSKKDQYDSRWFDVGSIHTLINLRSLIEDNRLGFPSIERFSQVVRTLKLKRAELLLEAYPFEHFITDALERGLVHRLITRLSTNTLAALFHTHPHQLDRIQSEISTRSWNMLAEDASHWKSLGTASSYLLAFLDFMETYLEERFHTESADHTALIPLLDRAKEPVQKSLWLNALNPVDLYLALIPYSKRLQEDVVRNLAPVYRYFVLELLKGNITLNQFVGGEAIKNATETVCQFLYKQYYLYEREPGY